PQARRDRLRAGPSRPGTEAEDHQDRPVLSPAEGPLSVRLVSERPSAPEEDRRAKLRRLRDEGVEPYPHRFDGVVPISVVRGEQHGIEPEQETDVAYRVAGRLAARRGHGGAAFLDLVDRSGPIQVHARRDLLGERSFERLVSLDLGDLVGVDGTAFATKRGELTLRVSEWPLL